MHYEKVLVDELILRPKEEVVQVMQEAGIKLEEPLTLYCGNATTASVLYLALEEYQLVPKLTIFDGSWCEYSKIGKYPIPQVEAPLNQ